MMDKFDRLLEAIEHPDRFSTEELEEMLADDESRSYYQFMAASRSAMTPQPEPDIDKEWQHFADHHMRRKPLIVRLAARRGAAAAAVITAVALGAVAGSLIINRSSELPANTVQASLSAPVTTRIDKTIPLDQDTTVRADSASVVFVTFNNEPLVKIVAELADHYQAEVVINNQSAKKLRLYYNWNPGLTLQQILDQLNNFEQINITLSDNKIIVN